MAKKKSKRPNLSQETLERARAELRGERPEPMATAEVVRPMNTAAGTAKGKAVRRPAGNLATRRVPSIEELIGDYSYVIRDLRNVLILAAVLLVAIVVVAVVLPRPTG
jgi:hypothetical protein